MRNVTLTIDNLFSILFLLIRYRNNELKQINTLIEDIESKSESAAAQFRKMASYDAPYYIGTIVEIISQPNLTDEELSLLDEFDERRTIYYRIKTNIETYIVCDKVKLFDIGTKVLYMTNSSGKSFLKFALKQKYKDEGILESHLFKLSYHLIQLSDIRKFIATTLRLILFFVNNPGLEYINIDTSNNFDVKYRPNINTAVIPERSYKFITWITLFNEPPRDFQSIVMKLLVDAKDISFGRIWSILDKEFLDYTPLQRPKNLKDF